jgi:hypothetical protein
MREGFYWDTANVIPEEGYVTFDGENPKRVRWYGKKYAGTRHYFLKDLQQPLRWMATIEVLVVDYYALCQFDLSQLCRERIRLGSALSQASPDHYIWKYRYDQVPWGCFNLVYGDMPMEGWWPWPRKEPEADKKDEKDSGASRNGINGDHESLI